MPSAAGEPWEDRLGLVLADRDALMAVLAFVRLGADPRDAVEWVVFPGMEDDWS